MIILTTLSFFIMIVDSSLAPKSISMQLLIKCMQKMLWHPLHFFARI